MKNQNDNLQSGILTWLAGAATALCLSSAVFVFMLQHLFPLLVSLLVAVFLTSLLTLVVWHLIRRIIIPRVLAAPSWLGWLQFTLALTGAIFLVSRIPQGGLAENLRILIHANPSIQRLIQKKVKLIIRVPNDHASLVGSSAVELGYIRSEYGDISFSQFETQGNWVRLPDSLRTAGDAPASLTWHGYPGRKVTMVFLSSPDSTGVDVVCGDQSQSLDLSSAANPEGEVNATFEFPVDHYEILRIFFLVGLTGTAGFFLMLLFAFLNGKSPTTMLQRIAVPAFFTAYLLIGLFAYQDYGLSWDEPVQRRHGLVSAKFLALQIDPGFSDERFIEVPDLDTYGSRIYGVSLTLPLAVVEMLMRYTDIREIWLFRHYATFLFFLLGVAALFRLATERFRDWRLGLLGAAFLVLSPRIFGESFYNVKDTAFLAAFMIAMLFGLRFWRNPTVLHGVLFGITAAFATNLRVVTVMLVAAVPVYAFLCRPRPARPFWYGALAMGIVYILFVLIFWPASWSEPLTLLTRTFSTFSDYTRYDYVFLFRGIVIPGQDPPPEYLPLWIAISTPLLYIVLFIIGVIAATVSSIRSFRDILRSRIGEDLVFLALFSVPILTAIVLGSTLYSAWRHFFFVYAPFLMLALTGFKTIWQSIQTTLMNHSRRVALLLLVLLTAGSMVNTGHWMVANHPYQYVYFSDLVDQFGGRQAFDRDYWGLSIRQGLEYLLSQDDRDSISYFVDGGTFSHTQILTQDQRQRLNLLDNTIIEPDYTIRIFRNLAKMYPSEPIYVILVDNVPILEIYRNPLTNPSR